MVTIKINTFTTEELDALSDLALWNGTEDEVTITDTEHKRFLKTIADRRSVKTLLSKEDQSFLRRICNNSVLTEREKIKKLSNRFNVEETILHAWAEELGLSLESSEYAKAACHTLAKKKRYLISSAQNASPVNEEFLDNMKVYAKHIDAEIGIIATRYKNPTSVYEESGDRWDMKTHPYLTAKRQTLHKNLLLLADLKIQATAPNPTNGIELFGGMKSVIVGAPRIEMRSVPVLEDQIQKFLFSTGSVTSPNFTDTVAGGKAAEHHSFGFVVVEIENEDVVHIRNISAHEDGSFNDLIYRVDNGKVTQEGTEYLIWGDSHFAQKEDDVTKAFRNLCDELGVRKSILHDVWDSASVNVHNISNPVVQMELWRDGKAILKNELTQMLQELKWFEKNMDETIIIASNHDDMIDRAITNYSWRDFPPYNAESFVKLEKLVVDGKAPDGVIPYIINKNFTKVTAIGLDNSWVRHGVELGLHGHKGPNGARGNINGFAKLSTKTVIGHSHSPAIKWGCYQVGVSCGLKHGYNKGLSGWAYNGVTLNKYGKRQSITFNKDTLTYTTLY